MKSHEIHLGDIIVDPTTRTLTDLDRRVVQLRNKSKEVLLFLVKNPSRTVTKSEIIEAVWSDVIASDESLVQCIADIRRVIGKDARQILKTVPREGYCIHLSVKKQANLRYYLLPMGGIAITLIAGLLYLSDSPVEPLPERITDVQAEATPPGTSVTEAYLEVLQGRISANRISMKESLIAERHFRRAIDLDPLYARAHAELGTLLTVRFENGWVVFEKEDEEKALFYANKAVSLDPDLALSHYALGRLHSIIGNIEAAKVNLHRAMELEPENEDVRAYFGAVLNLQGDAKAALEILEPTVASHPSPPHWYYYALGHALFKLGDLKAADAAFANCLKLAENSPYCLRYQIALYSEAGRIDEANAVAQVYASIGFDPSVSAIMNVIKDKAPEYRARLEVAFRAAELPE